MAEGDAYFKPGDVLSAKKLNAPLELNEQDQVAPPSSPLSAHTGAGGRHTAYHRAPPTLVVKITGGGTSGLYAGTEQIPQSGGTWVNGTKTFTTSSPTNPLWEISGRTDVAVNTKVIAYFAPSAHRYIFQYGTC